MIRPLLLTVVRFTLTIGLGALGVAGCQAARPSNEYATIAADPGRNPDLARQKTLKAIDQIARGDLAAAETTLRAALDADVTFGPAHNDLGRVYFEQSKLYLAAWEFQFAIKLMPDAPEPHNNLGLVLERAGKLDEAIAQYDQALAASPDCPDFLGNAARARWRRGDRDPILGDLLNRLRASDAALAWKDWAAERIARLHSAAQPPASGPTSQPLFGT